MTLNTSNYDLITRRREMVSSLRLRGLSLREITAALANQNPPMVNPRSGKAFDAATIKADIDALKKEWREHASADIAEHHARELAEIGEIKRAAWSQKDPELALKALAQEVKLLGTLRQPDGLSITISVELVIQTVQALEAAGKDPAAIFQALLNKAKAEAAVKLDSGG